MRVTVARDGRVLDVRVGTSSGWPAIDAAELETIRKAAPLSAAAERDAGRSGGSGAAGDLQPASGRGR